VLAVVGHCTSEWPTIEAGTSGVGGLVDVLAGKAEGILFLAGFYSSVSHHTGHLPGGGGTVESFDIQSRYASAATPKLDDDINDHVTVGRRCHAGNAEGRSFVKVPEKGRVVLVLFQQLLVLGRHLAGEVLLDSRNIAVLHRLKESVKARMQLAHFRS
jgi:hypothetical protein